ncbi:hypothetical protein [Maritimibacter sp. DP1N21-5]|uniref:hypothetical protein n=1 Tax=Maritimibacter sp. DP1N21-5 TaxID=2836867 RepID=UPI001C45E87F|nr:hypothetical protein [Maritimibacter sp. DP1N21-5]MBV7408084.1 hypothetical protein [Maritimibacter sp. DP1N21-5]
MAPRDFSIFDESPWFRAGPGKLGPASRVPTMVSHETELLLHWLGAEWLTGHGAVVDLGAFAGGCTARVAEGLAQAGRQPALHAFDRFTATEHHKRDMLYPAGAPAFDGPHMEEATRALLAPWAQTLALHKGEIGREDWEGGPIELLIVDAAKSTEALDAIAGTFYPDLLPDAIVVFIDAFHWRQPWVPVQVHRLAPHVVPLAHVTDHTLVTRVTSPLGPEAIAAAHVDGLSDAALLAGIAEAHPLFAAFGEELRMLEMAEAIERAPGVRLSWKMLPK